MDNNTMYTMVIAYIFGVAGYSTSISKIYNVIMSVVGMVVVCLSLKIITGSW